MRILQPQLFGHQRNAVGNDICLHLGVCVQLFQKPQGRRPLRCFSTRVDACLDVSPGVPYWMFPKIGLPQIGWFIMENPIKMDDLGGFPSIFGNTHIASGVIYHLMSLQTTSWGDEWMRWKWRGRSLRGCILLVVLMDFVKLQAFAIHTGRFK